MKSIIIKYCKTESIKVQGVGEPGENCLDRVSESGSRKSYEQEYVSDTNASHTKPIGGFG
jgi:hypothetical protein